MKMRIFIFSILIIVISTFQCQIVKNKTNSDPLPSWNDGQTKQNILDFVRQVSDPGSSQYVKLGARVAVFDNDGTLWAENPIYFQNYFVTQLIKSRALQHPEWQKLQPFKAALESDFNYLGQMSSQEFIALITTALGGMQQQEFEIMAKAFLDTTKHPIRHTLFTNLVYKPMLELVAFLQSNDFKVFIVSGGAIDFIRSYCEEVYGIPRENVIGSSLKYEYRQVGDKWEIFRSHKINSNNYEHVKPENIQLHIGRRPILAVGNSDGDLQMLKFTDDGTDPSLVLVMHHDDAQREYAYDRNSRIGRLVKALDIAQERGWTVVSMKNDFKIVFP